MARKEISIQGASTAEEVLTAVGWALNWWEDSEDEIMGLFKELCAEIEAVASVAFDNAPRAIRSAMLQEALKRYGFRFQGEEISIVKKALKSLDKLASTRNEIAHGRVVHYTGHGEQGFVLSEGYYLLPSLHEGEQIMRGFRYHHTPKTISEWVEKLRDARWEILKVRLALLVRAQKDRSAASPDWVIQRRKALSIASGEVPASEIGKFMRALSEWS